MGEPSHEIPASARKSSQPNLQACKSPAERARIYHALILQRLRGAQDQIAAAIGVHESTISRAKEDLDRFCQITAHAGLKVVSEEMVCISRAEVELLRKTYVRVSQHAPWVLDEEAE